MTQNRNLKVFLCHSKDDKSKVHDLYHRLITDGFDVWLDEEKLMPGQDWDLEIRKAVRDTDVVVVCVSKGSTTKAGYVQKEIRFALDIADEQPEGAIFIIPARLEDCEVPERLSRWQWVNLFEESGYKKLCTSLGLRAEALESIPSFRYDFEPQMVKIHAGVFMMGTSIDQAQAVLVSTDYDGDIIANLAFEQPQHLVDLSEYYIGKYPITNHEYQFFVRELKYKPPRDWKDDQFPDEKKHYPVTWVSWEDASMYCRWLSEKTKRQYRLPTETEWEKAARWVDERIYPWGNDFDSKKFTAYVPFRNNETIYEVGKFSSQSNSPYGCADMAGGVFEWCNDWFSADEYRTRQVRVKNPQGPKTGSERVQKGGMWFYDTNIYDVRSALRFSQPPTVKLDCMGFRCACSS